MELEVNGKPVSTEAATLAALLTERGLDAAHLACAVNGEFVPRSEHAQHLLEAGAKVEILAPMQGG